jgi:rubredoxin
MKPGRHICTECNSIYEEPHESLDPNRKSFDSLPDSFKCQCGATKDMFQPCTCATVEEEELKHEQHCQMHK